MNNVVLICLDSIRKDFFDRYAPQLRSRAGLDYSHCRAASSWSVPSHASMISGSRVSDHGIHAYNTSFDSLPKAETVYGDLDTHVALGVSANAWASTDYGFDSYFDTFSDITPQSRFPEGLDLMNFAHGSDRSGYHYYLDYLSASLTDSHPLQSVLNGVLTKVDSISRPNSSLPRLVDDGATAILRRSREQITATNEPSISFLNIMDGHIHLLPTRGYDTNLYPDVPNSWSSDEFDVWELSTGGDHEFYWNKREQLYAACIDYLDRRIVRYIDRVQAQTELETTFVITADHGENLGRPEEDGLANHKSSLSEGLLHVPLLVINPPVSEGETVTDELVSHHQLRELLFGLAHGEVPDISRSVLGAELAGMSAGPEPDGNLEYWDRSIRCAYRNDEKVIWDSLGTITKHEIDDATASWQSASEEISAVPKWAMELFPGGMDVLGGTDERTPHEMDSSTKHRLEDLGYL